MTESEFVELIDCRFPYNDPSQWQPLVELGASISPNAAFMVLHELCRPPVGAGVSTREVMVILQHWVEHFDHPLKSIILPVATTMIQGGNVSVSESMTIMRDIAKYLGQYCALAIAYMACDSPDGQADQLHQEIIEEWRRKLL